MKEWLLHVRADWVAYFKGGAAVTFPAWSQLMVSGWQVFIAILGAIVLILTIWSKALEIRQRRKDLRK